MPLTLAHAPTPLPLSRGRGLTLLALVCCLLPVPSAASTMTVVAGIPPVADMVRQVGGDRVTVRLLLPPGASPHSFEPTPSLVREFSGARLFFQVGAGLESWAARLVAAAGKDVETVTLSEGIPLVRDEEGGASGNPHVWLDPVLAVGMVGRIREALAAADPGGADVYRSRAEGYTDRLRRLDADVRAAVDSFRVRDFVSFHPSWTYFAARYGLTSAGVIEESPGKEPTPRQLAAIVAAIRRAGIRAVFAEPQLNPKPAEVIAREAGVRVVILDPVGGLPGRETYEGLMRWNLARMAEAMR